MCVGSSDTRCPLLCWAYSALKARGGALPLFPGRSCFASHRRPGAMPSPPAPFVSPVPKRTIVRKLDRNCQPALLLLARLGSGLHSWLAIGHHASVQPFCHCRCSVSSRQCAQGAGLNSTHRPHFYLSCISHCRCSVSSCRRARAVWASTWWAQTRSSFMTAIGTQPWTHRWGRTAGANWRDVLCLLRQPYDSDTRTQPWTGR